jgi:hypothetical protein
LIRFSDHFASFSVSLCESVERLGIKPARLKRGPYFIDVVANVIKIEHWLIL